MESCLTKEAISIVNEILEREPGYKRYSQTDDFRRNVKSLRQFFFKAIDRAYRQYHKELERIDKMTATPAHKEILKKAARNEYEETVEKIQDTLTS